MVVSVLDMTRSKMQFKAVISVHGLLDSTVDKELSLPKCWSYMLIMILAISVAIGFLVLYVNPLAIPGLAEAAHKVVGA